LSEQEEKRLEAENIERPSTKWVFEGFYKVELKVVLDRQPLLGMALYQTGCATLRMVGRWWR